MAAARTLFDCLTRCDSLQLPKQQHQQCDTTCKNTFMATAGSTQTDDGHGGKVFRDAIGDEVRIDSRGGKVFVPAQG
jgi:hypothetical protein